MSDRRLQVFHAVAGVLSFTRAAEQLNMTQPAVTHQIRQLEEELNTRLFDRANNRINLTSAGQRVFEYADRILVLYAEMDESVKVLTGDASGLVTVGASTTVAEYLLPGMLGAFRRTRPAVQVRLRVANTDAIVAMVADNTVDLGVVEGEVNHQLLRVEAGQSDELVVALPCDHPLVGRGAVLPADLLDYPFIVREDGSGTRSVIARYLQRHGLHEDQLNRSFELGSTEAIKGAVQAGLGISIVSRVTLSKEIELGLMAQRPLAPALDRHFYFVLPRQRFRAQVMETLYEFARQYRPRGEQTSAR